MDLIINLIIIIVIVISVIKRMQEVAKKGETLGAPVPTPPVVSRKDIPALPEQETPKPTPQDIFRELFPQMRAEDYEEEKPYSEEKWEPERDFREPEPVLKVNRETRISDMEENFEKVPSAVESYMKELSKKQDLLDREYALCTKSRGFMTSFRGTELERGIVMAEILGKPVGMREIGF